MHRNTLKISITTTSESLADDAYKAITAILREIERDPEVTQGSANFHATVDASTLVRSREEIGVSLRKPRYDDETKPVKATVGRPRKVV